MFLFRFVSFLVTAEENYSSAGIPPSPGLKVSLSIRPVLSPVLVPVLVPVHFRSISVDFHLTRSQTVDKHQKDFRRQ